MQTPPDISGKHLAILGVGRSGRAAAALALRAGATVSAWDQAAPDAFENLPPAVTIHPGITIETAAKFSADIIVLSPGIDTYSPLVQAFAKNATELIGEVELAARFYPGTIVGITGTNGKTTTTELIARILEYAGLTGTPCGNYGTPFAEIVLNPHSPAAISLELSSFQLETIDTLHPKISVWLNFAPDHMDRYPTIQSYHDAKLRIFKNQTPADTAIVRHGENLGPLLPKIVTFSTETQNADYYSDGITITHHGKTILNLETQTSLRGLHNAENAMAAIAASAALNIDPALIPDALHGYAPPPHRCELIRTLDGVEYLNDSKATNLHALHCALRSQNRPIVLIAGGKEKGLDYTPLLPILSKHAIAAVTFGQIARPLASTFSEAVPSTAVNTLQEAITSARSLAPRGSTILLSPGTSSFDQFSGYEQRGNTFRDFVHQLH